MGAAKKTKLWRLLGKSYAVPAFTKTVEPLRGLINQVSTWGYHVRHDEIPWTPFTKKLAESRLAIVTTAGLILEGQKPFDIDAVVRVVREVLAAADVADAADEPAGTGPGS